MTSAPEKVKIAQQHTVGPRSAALTASFFALAVLLGFCRAWAHRHAMNIDGIAYLDIADAYARGDWPAAISAYWNPLYTWVLAGGFKLFHPAASAEFPTVHYINVGIYVFTLACFHVFLRSVMTYRRHLDNSTDGGARVPETAWIVFGYTVFIYSSIEVIGPDTVSPDLLVAGFIYLASALLVRMHRGEIGLRWHFVLGACLGMAYLTKVGTALPVIACFVLASFSLRGALKSRIIRLIAVAAGLTLVAGPWVAVLSHRQGRFTISETGRLAYAWFVNWTPSIHWLGEIPGVGEPVHPHKKVFDKPAAYSVESPFKATYPVWYDPVYWCEGVKIRFDLRKQLYVIYMNLQVMCKLFLNGPQTVFLAGVLGLYLFDRRWRCILRNLSAVWFLVLASLGTVAMYTIVHVEERFFSAAVTLLWVSLVAVACPTGGAMDGRLLRGIATAAAVGALAPIVTATALQVYEIGTEPPQHWQIAEHLHREGIMEGDRIGVLGEANLCGWARLARVQISADIPYSSAWDYRAASDEVKSRALQAVIATGVKAVVADHREGSGCPWGWRALGETGFYLCKPR